MITAFVVGNDIIKSSTPPGASLVVSRIGTGQYAVTVTGLGTGSFPVPTTTVFGNSGAYMYLSTAFTFGPGHVEGTLQSSDGNDHMFLLTVTGT